MRTLKARSSRWVHDTFPDSRTFTWQEGYAVFSVSKSVEANVKAYIENQAEHHKNRDFMEELLALLHAHGIVYDERFVLD